MGGKRKRAALNREKKAARQKTNGGQVRIPVFSGLQGANGPRIVFSPPVESRTDLASAATEESMPAETTVYKYLSRQYADALLRGNTRIGTLHDFRRVEHGKGIADPDEGKKVLRHVVVNERYVGGTPEADAMLHMGFDIGNGGTLAIDGITFERSVDHPDALVWCCSSQCDATVMGELDGAEACIEITNAGAFFDAMTEAINVKRKAKFLGFREVAYLPREQKWNQADLGGSAAYLKESGAYGAQYEIRAVWLPFDNDPVQPLIIDSQGLAIHCRDVTPSVPLGASTTEVPPPLA